MRQLLFIFLLALTTVCAKGEMFSLGQQNFDVSGGWQTRQMQDSPAYTNYFAIRAESNNYMFLESHQGAFAGLIESVVTNDWYGGSEFFTTERTDTRMVLPLSPGQGNFTLELTNVYPGVYGVQIFGVVTNDVQTAIRPQLLWKIQANDGPYGETNTYHLIQNYVTNRCYDICQFWVQAIKKSGQSNHIIVTVSLDSASEVSAHIVALHFFSPVDYSDTNISKSSATLYTANERQDRINYALSNETEPDAFNTITDQEKTNLFNRWKPLNSMTDEQNGAYATNVGGIKAWMPFPNNANLQAYAAEYKQPWGWTNVVTHEIYSLADWLNGSVVPGTTNDHTGFYYTNGGYASTFGAQNGYFIYRDYVMPMLFGAGLPYTFYSWPNHTNEAHAAGLILAKFAIVYPTYRLEAIDINSNMSKPSAYLSYPWGRWSLRRTGKFEYDGWAGSREGQIATAIDYLWPYLTDSQSYADDVTRFVPWIEGDTNNVKIMLWMLLRSLAFDQGYRSRGGDPMQVGLALQSGIMSSNLMNPSLATLEVTPSAANGSWKKHYAGTYTRDGINLIGSSFYIPGENVLISGPDKTRRYKELGNSVGAIDISDATQFKKLGEFVDWYCDNRVGFGYDASFGDAGMSINEGPGLEMGNDSAFLLKLWRVKNNSRLSKYLVDVIGRSGQTDAEWLATTEQAATVATNIRKSSQSRIYGGVGLGILEHNPATTNQLEAGAIVLRAVGGYGHDHGDHLDLNIYALGSRMGTDIAQRNEGENVTYPRAVATRVHNVVEIDGYNHEKNINNGWPGGDSEGGYSQYTAFSTNGSSQMIGADLWHGASHSNVDYHHRDIALTRIDATNFYVVDFQRVNGGRFHSWSFHGADVGGEIGGFSISVSTTNTPLDFTDTETCNPAFFMRKHAVTAPYNIKAFEGGAGSKIYSEWRLGRTATSAGAIRNADGNPASDTTTIAPEQAMFGSAYSALSPRKFVRATLFDRTNDLVGTAWLFSSAYHILQPRTYVFTPGTTYFTNLTERSGTWAAMYDPYLEGSRVVISESSLPTDSGLTNAFQPKVLEVVSAVGTDRHYSSATNGNFSSGGDSWSGTYGFTRRVDGAVSEWKLVGGTNLSAGGAVISVATNALKATIASAQWASNTFVLSSPWPGVKRTGWHRIRNDNHETSYHITGWSNDTTVAYREDALCGELDVSSATDSGVTCSSAAGGMVLATYPKRGAGITAANEARNKIFSGNYGGSTSVTRTSGDSITTSDFTDADGDGFTSVFLYDFGPGDTVEVPTEVYVRKNDDTSYTVAANTGFTFSAFDSSGWTINGTEIVDGVVQTASLTGEPQEVTRQATRHRQSFGSAAMGAGSIR